MKRLLLGAASIVAVSLLGLTAPAGAQGEVRVIDGDTIAVDGTTVRIMGLDAPELHARCPAELALAQAARDRLAVLLQGGATIWPHGRDRYRRVLAVVRDATGRDVAQVMIGEGLAREYHGRGPRQGWCP